MVTAIRISVTPLTQKGNNKKKKKKEKPTATALLPYQQSTSNKISGLLSKYDIRTIHVPAKKTCHMLRPVKDDPGLKIPGVYGIPCECGKTYIGQTKRTIETRRKEHIRQLRLGHVTFQ
jgi:2,3-bisphosphoglycerate-independent phosphoglycerate mutase